MANNDKVPELTNGEFDEFIKKGVAFVDFFAEWCMPCLMQSPIIEDLAEQLTEVKFVKINKEDNEELTRKLGVASIPCLVIFKEGKEVERIIGIHSAEVIEKKVRGHMC